MSNYTIKDINISLPAPIWENPIISSSDSSSAAYMLHYLVDSCSSFEDHCAKIASIIDAANVRSAVYPKTCAYICNDVGHITYEKITEKIRTFLHTKPVVLPITVIGLSIPTGTTEASAEIIKYMIRQTKRLAHPPIIFEKRLIIFEGITDPVIAIIARSAERSQQLIRIHMLHAPSIIKITTEFDFLNKIIFYSPMEVTGF